LAAVANQTNAARTCLRRCVIAESKLKNYKREQHKNDLHLDASTFENK
jgi:hypothetical protein